MKPNEDKYEGLFYEVMTRLFCGVTLQGQGGAINLMKIKEGYYRRVMKVFKKEIDANPLVTLSKSFKEELYQRLYTFFKVYLSEGGAAYFMKIANWQKVYEKIYSDYEDVSLFWKTKDLYYVKSEIAYRDIEVIVEDEKTDKAYTFSFSVKHLEVERNNTKVNLVFSAEEGFKNEYLIDVKKSEKGKKTKMDALAKELGVPEDVLFKAIQSFHRQTEVDFFLSPKVRTFLGEQLHLFFHQILIAEENVWKQERLSQVQTMHAFCSKLIDFVSQFEEELVRVWRKPKFVRRLGYVMTIDQLGDLECTRLFHLPGFEKQLAEWKSLNLVPDDFHGYADLYKTGLMGEEMHDRYRYLPFDTRHFDRAFPDRLIGSVKDIDAKTDGILIHSDNWQALHTLQNKYRGKVKLIYIDPPFNLGSNADYAYKVNYKDSTWITMLENRLLLAREFLSEDGSIFVRCDYNGNHYVRMLLNKIFGEENFRNEIIVRRGSPKAGLFVQFEGLKTLGVTIDSILLYGKSDSFMINETKRKIPFRAGYWGGFKKVYDRPTMRYNIEGIDIQKGQWMWGKDKAYKAIENYKNYLSYTEQEKISIEDYCEKIAKQKLDFVRRRNNTIEYYVFSKDEELLDNSWVDISGYSSTTDFKTENSEKLLERVIETASERGDLVMDFFMGSGTTQAVAQKLGRRWIGVEMGEQFETVDLRRMKEVLGGKQSGISKDLKGEKAYRGGGIIKYYTLEQYADTLERMRYEHVKDADILLLEDSKKTLYQQYIFFADKKFAHVIERTPNIDALTLYFKRLYDDIDFGETLSNLLGLPIKRRMKDSVILADDKEYFTNLDKLKTTEEKLAFVRRYKKLLWWGEVG